MCEQTGQVKIGFAKQGPHLATWTTFVSFCQWCLHCDSPETAAGCLGGKDGRCMDKEVSKGERETLLCWLARGLTFILTGPQQVDDIGMVAQLAKDF